MKDQQNQIVSKRNQSMQSIAFFDFDGTITSQDSLLHFAKCSKGPLFFYTALLILAPLLILNKAGIITSQFTKNSFIIFYFGNMPETCFQKLCDDYAGRKLKAILKQASLDQIQWHKDLGHRVIVVSASPENYLQPWCSNMNIECIATKLEVKKEKITGNIDGANCSHEEKRKRIEAMVNIADYDEIYGYGDTPADQAMLSLCTKRFYQYL